MQKRLVKVFLTKKFLGRSCGGDDSANEEQGLDISLGAEDDSPESIDAAEDLFRYCLS